jgi:patatin-like phospholipase/acyl hydrolase
MALRVLTIDGGGIRGVFAARFLQKLEECGKPLSKCFDVVVGTSTGGIIALAIGYEKSLRLITELYTAHGRKIFPRRPLGPLHSVFTAKYSNVALMSHLQSIFGETLKFESPSCRHLLVQSYNLQIGRSKIFRAGVSGPIADADFLVWQIAAATSAAPTYFPAFKIPEKGLFVDGGIWANNPALIGVMEALRLGFSLDQVRLLSVGTGSKIFRADKARGGYLSWRGDLVEMTFQSQSDGVHQLATAIATPACQYARLNYYRRVTPPLRDEEASLDQIKTVPTLKQLADTAAEELLEELRLNFVT